MFGIEDAYTADGGFSASRSRQKILWWVPGGGNHALIIGIRSIPAGGYSADLTIRPPGPNRRDYPMGLLTPPVGCYALYVAVGDLSGVIVDQVVP